MKFSELTTKDDKSKYLNDCDIESFKLNYFNNDGHVYTFKDIDYYLISMIMLKHIDEVSANGNRIDFDSIDYIKKMQCKNCGTFTKVDITVNMDDHSIDLYFQDQEESKCSYYSNQHVFKFPFKCKSGKLVFANNFYDIPTFEQLNQKSGGYNINYRTESIRTVHEYSQENFLNMICLNQCPQVHQNPETGEINVCDMDYVHAGFEYVNSVCTDLWAVHAIDYDDFKEHEADFDDDYFILDVSKLGVDLIFEYHYDFIYRRGDKVLGKIYKAV